MNSKEYDLELELSKSKGLIRSVRGYNLTFRGIIRFLWKQLGRIKLIGGCFI
jgi:hypothetical protein